MTPNGGTTATDGGAMSVDRDPSRIGLGLTAAAGSLAVAGTLLAAGGVTLLGVAVSVAGVYRCSRRLLGVGVLALFVGVFAASTTGVPVGLVVLGMIGTTLAWDVGENAISVAEQLRNRARSTRVEAVHAASSGLVAGFFGLGTYIVYLLSAGGQPVAAVVLLFVGAVVGLYALVR